MEKKRITITIDDNIHNSAVEIAKSLGMSLSAFITMLINNYKAGK